MSAAELVARLAQEGIDPTLLAEVAQELFAGEIERAALADRRKNERERKARSRVVTGQNGTGRERRGHPPKDIKSKPPMSSEANASGCADPVKDLFDFGVSVLTEAGMSEKQARSLIGKWRKAKPDGDVLTGLSECRARSISNPVEWLEKRFKPARYISPSGYEYRGSLEQVEREARKRHDTSTIWQIEVDRKQGMVAHA